MIFRFYISSIFIIIAITTSAVAQQANSTSENLTFKNYTTKDGLSQSSVVSIVQDTNGFLWFGTRYGLNKFDGHTFKTYNYNAEDKNSLTHNWITFLHVDAQDTLWIGTKNGLNTYSPEKDNFNRFKENDKLYYEKEVWDLKSKDSTYLWIATNQGLDRLNIKTKHIFSFKHDKFKEYGLSSNEIKAILPTKNGTVWICTKDGIDLFKPNSNSFENFTYPNNKAPNLTKNSTVTLFEDKNGDVWLGYDEGLALFDKKKNLFQNYRFKSKTYISSAVRTICEDKFGALWVGAYDGLYQLNKDKTSFKKNVHDITNPNSLSQNSIYKITEDNRGDLWIGTWAGGINYINRSTNFFETIHSGIYPINLNYKVVSSIVEDSNENLWVGTEGGGINFYNKNTHQFEYFTHNPNDKNSISSNNIKAILLDHSGNLWIGTHDAGVNFLDPKKRPFHFIKYTHQQGDKHSLSNNKITAILEDEFHNIWVGTNASGLYLYDALKQEFVKIPDPHNYIGDFVITITKSENKNLLYIGGAYGLTVFDVSSKKIKPLDYKNGKKSNYNINQVASVLTLPHNNIWVGTEGDGLYNYNTSTKESKRYGVKQGLPDEVVYGILSDDDDNLWVSTNKGLARFSLKDKTIKNFNVSDDLKNNEFNYGAYLKLANGNLAFGSTNGLTLFNPKKIEDDNFIPSPIITGIKIRNKPDIKYVHANEVIVLEHNQNDFSLSFVALGYSKPQKNQYSYTLEGFDSGWNFSGNTKTASYTNLNPGEYVFKVKASNSDGVWNATPTLVTLTVLSPFWKTWMAYTLYFITFITLFLILRKYTLIRIKEHNELKLERLGKKHSEEANRLKLQLFTNISHDFRTPLTLMVGPLKRLIDDTDTDTKSQLKLQGIYRNVNILLQLINQLLDFRKSEVGKLTVSVSEVALIPFIKNIKLSFEELAKEKEIDFKLYTKGSFDDIWLDTIEMKKVFFNILSNAFKFTPQNGKITINLSMETKSVNKKTLNFLKITVQDTGRGIPKDNIAFVFDRYFQFGKKNELQTGTGVGLALAKDIIELHHGHIEFTSKENEGSCITISLLTGKSHFSKEEIRKVSESKTQSIGILQHYEPTVINTDLAEKNNSITEPVLSNSLQTILIVEDNLEIRNFMKSIFKNIYNVLEATNGEMGIRMAASESVDLIISDIMMPKMDGIKMCSLLKLDIKTSHIPIILLTARVSSKTQRKGYKTGADAYITKPFDAELLILQIGNLLKSRQKLIDKFKKDILIEPKKITVVSTDEIFLEKAMKIIEDNLSNPDFNVNTLTEKINMSQSVLYRKFKALTGHSSSEFIRIIRIKKASQLILKTNMSVIEVADDVGFNDIKYFRKCFKDNFKMTPSAYRKSQIKD
ncbi:two-component regulator propeller domain-containing protein [Mariniflexile ostreae]|uniref:histidine kinase n=1 Tax=Mariniflexile ostreae TaxID=1520892 RepID=A0ABV5F9K1_9FLAO